MQRIVLYSMLVNKQIYHVDTHEFKVVPHKDYTNLKILDKLGLWERMASLIQELALVGCTEATFVQPSHGGFLSIQCAPHFDRIQIVGSNENTKKNVSVSKCKNIVLYDSFNEQRIHRGHVLFCEDWKNLYPDWLTNLWVQHSLPMVITNRLVPQKDGEKDTWAQMYASIYRLSNTDFYIYVPEDMQDAFQHEFHYFMKTEGDLKTLDYDNLIHLVIMVKNGGAQFEQMLEKNAAWADRWTILDTGSTDGTVDIIKKVLVGKKKGALYEEPFINFRDSRNRCIELAGKTCKYIVTLDDTYVVQGDLRLFLNTVRGDQFADSFSMYIQSDDNQYASNRVIKTASNLKYIYRIHEVIQDKDNVNVIVPNTAAFIFDGRFEYMESRTMGRKQLDLKLLYEELEENPMEPRTYYYLAQTYNLMEDHERAFQYFLKRAEFISSGFIQERIDALFEAARLANFKLNKPWEQCLDLYERAYKADESRPESIYFIGVHYFLKGDRKTAFRYFKQALIIGYPLHCQYGLKPTLSFHFLPKFVAQLAYEFEEYDIGLAATELFLKNNPPSAANFQEMVSWHSIYQKLTMYKGPRSLTLEPEGKKPLFVFVADGGFEPWSGKNILTTGVGGSETYIIEMARHIQQQKVYDVIVFCNTPNEKTDLFEGVEYRHLNGYAEFVATHYVKHCVISRFSEYCPVSFKGFTENVYIVVHDLTTTGVVIPMDPKLKKIFCLTEWHVEYFTQIFPALKPITVPFYYGIDIHKFACKNESPLHKIEKVPYKFIYSSFPNRGLLPLLQMWPLIVESQPLASLHIYADIHGKWVNSVAKEEMELIRQLVDKYGTRPSMHVHYHGWVDKQTLAQAWKTADIWFYPCTFMETFCLTALEAALSNTLVITNDLAALKNTVGDRGIVIPGDPSTNEWKHAALEKVFSVIHPSANSIQLKNDCIQRNYTWASTMSWSNQAAKLCGTYIDVERLEHRGVYNPFISPANMTELISYYRDEYRKEGVFEPLKILEVGTWTGCSLIQLVQHIPHSMGWGIDLWPNAKGLQEEKAFYKNVAVCDMQDRILGIKGDACTVLTNMMQRKTRFDFIYVDAGVEERTLDIWLAWQCLNKGGYLLNNLRLDLDLNVDSALELFLVKLGGLDSGNFTVKQMHGLVFIKKLVV